MKYFIEIGSNNYNTLADLAKTKEWTGVLVEPLKHVFDTIERVDGCFYENIAITENGGNCKFYYYDYAWSNGWGTVEKDHLKKLIDPLDSSRKLEDPKCVETPSITFNELYKKYNFPKLDLLKIDAESYDGKIVRSIDFSKVCIDKIIFEHHHLSTTELLETIFYLSDNKMSLSAFDKDNIMFVRYEK
jgi:FkbM family methyltransferase